MPTLKKPPFRAFKNPFLSGGDRIWPPETLVTYTYDALQSWVREQPGTPGSPQTPREFCRQLAEEIVGHVRTRASNIRPDHAGALRLAVLE